MNHATAQDRETGAAPGPLGRILDDILSLEPTIAPVGLDALARLRGLQGRLASGQLQLAVVGQFKRGKSTLLNALMGEEVLPTGLLPVTAVPTFMRFAATIGLTVAYQDGRLEEVALASAAELRGRLAGLVTEEGNPENRLGVARVLVGAPSSLLGDGVVLIDTPGVGSTHRHNTDAAESALPACDAALFVVAPDPPITQVEADYLARVRSTVAHIILILNKVDSLEGAEVGQVEGFLRKTLDQNGLGDAAVFPVSARLALRGKREGDAETLRRSGVPALEAYLTRFLAHDKKAVLSRAIALKAQAASIDLDFQIRLALRTLGMPLDELERGRGVFEAALGGLETERRMAADLLVGDRSRLFATIDEDADELRKRLQSLLEGEIDRRTADGEDAGHAWLDVQDNLPHLLQAELDAAVAKLRADVEALFAAHQARGDQLIERIAAASAEVLGIEYRAPARESGFEARFLPYWVVSRPESLNPLPPGTFDPLLPGGLRQRHARARAGKAIADLALRNVENLRWALRRNVDEAFRRYRSELDERFAASAAGTRDVMDTAITRRQAYAAEIEAQAARLDIASAKVREVEAALNSFLRPDAGMNKRDRV